jgi:hypothetical protein
VDLVEVEQLLPAAFGGPLTPPLLVHDAHRADTRLVSRAPEQLLDLLGRHLYEPLGEREDLPHAHPYELVAIAILAIAGLEVSLVLLPPLRRAVRL